MRSNLRAFVPALAMLAAAVGGCSTTVTLQHYPSFHEPSLKTVAVAPFANATLHDKAGQFLAERLAEALRANRTYEVVGPQELTARFEAAGIKLPAGAAPTTIAEGVRKLGGIQAVIVGTARGFSAERGSYVEIEEGYPYYGYGWGYGYGRRDWGYGGHGYGGYPIYRQYSYTQAYAAASAKMVRVADGEVLHVTAQPLAARRVSGRYPSDTKDQVLLEAGDAVVGGLVAEFAVVPMRVKINKGKALRTARAGKEADELKNTNDFRLDDEKLYVVVSLPPEADRNEFRLVIAREDDDKPLAEETIRWSAADASRRLAYSPRDLADAAGGPGDFEARLYLGDQRILGRGFEIKK